jgi:3-deoxy-D-manno-octulosonic-acid transferase
MQVLYSISIFFYGLAIRIATQFNQKAELWWKGRIGIFDELTKSFITLRSENEDRRTAWFHCASLGEFEQGRPLIEAFRKKYPNYLILLTFFSPSGYEVRKNYAGADLVTYLPLDTRRNARRFINIIQPEIVFFVKYEFWFNYLLLLQQRKVPHYLVSAIFRPDQHFFKWYGDWSRSILRGFTHIFVQNENSRELLEFVDIPHVTVSGDTRFDRVEEIASAPKSFPIIEAFAGEDLILVAGSTWPADEEILLKYLGESKRKLKVILAPHEIKEETIKSMCNVPGVPAIRYSLATTGNVNQARLLIIDSIGILSQLYRFGQIAYIGGGFGSGIHNILEAAVYGVPIIFGPVHNKFQEATDLLNCRGAYVIHHYKDLEQQLNTLQDHPGTRLEAAANSRDYVVERLGATDNILDHLQLF